MKKRIITFRLKKGTASDYNIIHSKIDDIVDGYAKISDNVYVTISEKSADSLVNTINKLDNKLSGQITEVFVATWSRPASWTGLPAEVSKWIENN